MGAFVCCECDNYRDSDDGCMECKRHELGLICEDCTSNMDDEKYKEMTGEDS